MNGKEGAQIGTARRCCRQADRNTVVSNAKGLVNLCSIGRIWTQVTKYVYLIVLYVDKMTFKKALLLASNIWCSIALQIDDQRFLPPHTPSFNKNSNIGLHCPCKTKQLLRTSLKRLSGWFISIQPLVFMSTEARKGKGSVSPTQPSPTTPLPPFFFLLCLTQSPVE